MLPPTILFDQVLSNPPASPPPLELLMSCKPESKKQRIERIAVQVLAAATANSHEAFCALSRKQTATFAIEQARELINQLDSLPLDE